MENSKHLPTSVKDLIITEIQGMNLDFSNFNQAIAARNQHLANERPNFKKENVFKRKNMDVICQVQILDQLRGMLIVKMIMKGYPFYYNAESDIEVIKSIIKGCNINLQADMEVHFVQPLGVEKFVDDHGSTIHLVK